MYNYPLLLCFLSLSHSFYSHSFLISLKLSFPPSSSLSPLFLSSSRSYYLSLSIFTYLSIYLSSFLSMFISFLSFSLRFFYYLSLLSFLSLSLSLPLFLSLPYSLSFFSLSLLLSPFLFLSFSLQVSHIISLSLSLSLSLFLPPFMLRLSKTWDWLTDNVIPFNVRTFQVLFSKPSSTKRTQYNDVCMTIKCLVKKNSLNLLYNVIFDLRVGWVVNFNRK